MTDTSKETALACADYCQKLSEGFEAQGGPDNMTANFTLIAETLLALSAENEALRERAYQLAYAITGGEDAPGLLESIPTDDLSAMIRSERAGHRDYEHSLRAQVETARADGRNEALDEAARLIEGNAVYFNQAFEKATAKAILDNIHDLVRTENARGDAAAIRALKTQEPE